MHLPDFYLFSSLGDGYHIDVHCSSNIGIWNVQLGNVYQPNVAIAVILGCFGVWYFTRLASQLEHVGQKLSWWAS